MPDFSPRSVQLAICGANRSLNDDAPPEARCSGVEHPTNNANETSVMKMRMRVVYRGSVAAVESLFRVVAR
jgi:hypothetical protein